MHVGIAFDGIVCYRHGRHAFVGCERVDQSDMSDAIVAGMSKQTMGMVYSHLGQPVWGSRRAEFDDGIEFGFVEGNLGQL